MHVDCAANVSTTFGNLCAFMAKTDYQYSANLYIITLFSLPSDKLADGLDEIDMLFNPTNQVAVSEVSVYNGTWKQTTVGSDFKNGIFILFPL